jgi:hypothetical protein
MLTVVVQERLQVLGTLLAKLPPLCLGTPAVSVSPCYQAAGRLKSGFLVAHPLHLEGACLSSEAVNLGNSKSIKIS